MMMFIKSYKIVHRKGCQTSSNEDLGLGLKLELARLVLFYF